MWWTFSVAFLVSAGLTGLFKEYALKKGLLDRPNARSAHTLPTPRGGGIVFMGLWLLGISWWGFFFSQQWILAVIPPLLAIGTISFLDDKWSLSAKWRFLVHIGASLYFLMVLPKGLNLNFFFFMGNSWLSYPVAFFLLLWSTNLFNFMDGSDGLAATEGIFVLGAGSLLLGVFYQAWMLAYPGFLMSFLLLGFLIWNWPPARIFMGDVGSAPLGFLIMAMALLAQQQVGMPIGVWCMLYGLFLCDATITLIRRMWRGEPWRQAHRRHAYQRLQQIHWSHQKIVFCLILCNAVIGMLSWLVLFYPAKSLLFIFLEAFILIGIYYMIEKISPFCI